MEVSATQKGGSIPELFASNGVFYHFLGTKRGPTETSGNFMTPLPEAGPARSTSYGGASSDLLPYEPCVAPPPQLSGSRQVAGWHHGPVEIGVPRIEPKSCTFGSWILKLNCRVESRFRITKPRVSRNIVIFGLLFQDLKNDHLLPNPRFCDVESRFRITLGAGFPKQDCTWIYF